jgi:hypothetical protein
MELVVEQNNEEGRCASRFSFSDTRGFPTPRMSETVHPPASR